MAWGMLESGALRLDILERWKGKGDSDIAAICEYMGCWQSVFREGVGCTRDRNTSVEAQQETL